MEENVPVKKTLAYLHKAKMSAMQNTCAKNIHGQNKKKKLLLHQLSEIIQLKLS
jgi:hypothetical protein